MTREGGANDEGSGGNDEGGGAGMTNGAPLAPTLQSGLFARRIQHTNDGGGEGMTRTLSRHAGLGSASSGILRRLKGDSLLHYSWIPISPSYMLSYPAR